MKTRSSHKRKTQLRAFIAANLIAYLFTGITTSAQTPFADGSLIAATGNIQTSNINLQELTVSALDNTVIIKLMMKGESEGSVLLFEKSLNGKEYKVIDQQDTWVGPETSAEILFQFQDTDPAKGVAYYRVLQIKKDGFYYSPTRVINFEPQVPVAFNEEDDE
jgi:hypothetical protein